MFKKGPDIDKKKLLLKACDVKKDSLTRLKHFKTLIEHLEYNELPTLFKSHFSFIYHTFIDTFSTFDCNSKQRRDDLACLVFMLEKILIFNAELIKKRWQFYSLTFVMQKLLHCNNTWQLRQEGLRLFIIWFQILGDETNIELQTIFASLVPNLVPQTSVSTVHVKSSNHQTFQKHAIEHEQHAISNQGPIKLCSIEPMMSALPNEQLPSDETSFYLDCLLQFMVTQLTKPYWNATDEVTTTRELCFSYLLNMFKRIYLPHLFPGFNMDTLSEIQTKPRQSESSSTHVYVDNSMESNIKHHHLDSNAIMTQNKPKRDFLNIDLRKSTHSSLVSSTNDEHEHLMALSIYQSIVIKWLTRIMRQDMILGQDDLMKSSNSGDRGDFRKVFRETSSSTHQDIEFSCTNDGNSTFIFPNMESTSCEMDIARRVAGTWPENISMLHELFRRAFLNYFQPASMKRVVNVYKEWICNGGPSQTSSSQNKTIRLGYTSFGDLLQVFVVNSSSAFLTRVHTVAMLDEQVEMCKRIMNIYRYMVMKIYMNTSTWEQLLNVMLTITEQLFPANPPEKKEATIGGRIAPAFFQTFIVSWIRANLYVHISTQMWNEFHRVMKSLIRWRELVEEWSTTMGSLTRVLVKHVYGLSLTDLPLEKPQDRRRRPRAMKSFSTAEVSNPSSGESKAELKNTLGKNQSNQRSGSKSDGNKQPNFAQAKFQTQSRLIRSNSDGLIVQSSSKLYYSSARFNESLGAEPKVRKVKSDCVVVESGDDLSVRIRSYSPHADALDGGSLKETNMIHHIDSDHVIESHVNIKSLETKRSDHKSSTDKCVLLGGSTRGWTTENSVIMWRRMLGLFGNLNNIDDPDNHLVAMRGLAVMLHDFIKTRENQGVSLDNQFTPELPSLIPPYLFNVGWLLQATHLPRQFRESRLTAYKLLCLMTIRKHDIELSQLHYVAFYEALHRGLMSSDAQVHATIIKNCTQLLTLELPGSTFLIQSLFERARSIVLNAPKEVTSASSSREQAIQILSSILALHRSLRKLLVIKPEANNTMSLVAPDDIRSKIFDTFLACNMRPVVLNSEARTQSLCSLVLHVYQELTDKYESYDIEKVFDTIMTDLQEPEVDINLIRMNCDLLKLFTDHAACLTQSRPALISTLIQMVCQLIVKLSTREKNKEAVHCLLLCLEDWCISAGRAYLFKSIDQLSSEDDEVLLNYLNEPLITVVLRSLDIVINGEQYLEESSNRGTKGSNASTSKGSDTISSSQQSQRSSRSELELGQQINREKLNTAELHELQINVPKTKEPSQAISLACKVTHLKLLTYLGHFPLRQVGAASMSCCVSEFDYLPNEEPEIFIKTHEVRLFVINDQTMVSFIGSSSSNAPSNAPNQQPPIHIIVRNLCGKFSWDTNYITVDPAPRTNTREEDALVVDPDTFQQDDMRASMKYDSDFNDDGNSSSSLSSRSSANRDCICDLLNQLASSGSQESSWQTLCKKRNSALSITNPRYKVASAEETMIALLTNQRFQELNYCEQSDEFEKVKLKFGCNRSRCKAVGDDSIQSSCNQSSELSFEKCRQLIQQLGYLSWDKRNKIDPLLKSGRLIRELKNLDGQPGRDTHKIAVLYIANGQEDKNSILTNSSASKAFEDFVSGLGWEVNLTSHLGFKGGLQTNKSTGETSPYYCNSTTEVMFHVSTRIPITGPADDEALNKKLRHLGNDEIHIVWSEHSRDYRRGIIPTEFGDVIIAIYPMLTFQGYYRVQISSKQDVPSFGPLFDNCIVYQTSLAALVRATAINASRAKRSCLPYYQSHYEERERLIKTIVKNHKECLSFEDFAVQLYKQTQDSGCPLVASAGPVF